MINRDQFMEFFREYNFHDNISPDDSKEIFLEVLHGSQDITIDLLKELLDAYGVTTFEVVTREVEE